MCGSQRVTCKKESVDRRNGKQAVKLGSKRLYSLNRLAGPFFTYELETPAWSYLNNWSSKGRKRWKAGQSSECFARFIGPTAEGLTP